MANTKGYIYRRGVTPETRTQISQKVKIFSYLAGSLEGVQNPGNASLVQIGAISSFNPSESRDAQEVRGLGFGDTIAELVPQNTAAMTIEVNRAMVQLNALYQSFGYLAHADGMVRSLKHHRWPFDIKEEMVLSLISDNEATSLVGVRRSTEGGKGGSRNAIVTYYEGCWMTNYGKTVTTDNTLVTENCTVKVTDVTDGNIAYRFDMQTGNKFKSRIFKDDDGVNRVRNLIGQTGDLFGVFR